MTLIETLEKLSVINRDNGHSAFTDTSRLDAISECLHHTNYMRIDNGSGLFHLYSLRNVQDIHEPVVVVSSHIDCADTITKCFTELLPNGLMLGTFDNAITNASLLHLMLEGRLPDNVLAAFTGDEEEDSNGARQLVEFTDKEGIDIRYAVVLDVTDMGWEEESDFTIENNFWRRMLGKKITASAMESGYEWRFVPSDPDNIPSYIDMKHVIPIEAEADESWEYDEHEVECFSLCLPVQGNMHSNMGVYARQASFERYTNILNRICNTGGID